MTAAPVAKPDVFAMLTHDVAPYSAAVCDPGERKLAWCNGTGLTGYRTCLEDGTYWSRTICPSGGQGLNQEADILIVTRASLAAHPDFSGLRDAIAAVGDHRVVVMKLDEIVEAFPATSVQRSLRLAEQHVFFNELRGMKYFIQHGRPVYLRRNAELTSLDFDWEMPMWYVKTPPATDLGDDELEEYLPSLMPYEYLRHPWQDVADQFWTPETPDVKAGYLPLDGSLVTCDDGSCAMSDFASMTLKLKMWAGQYAERPLVESSFDGFTCDGNSWRSFTDEVANLNQTQVVKYHDCSGGETGNAWDIAKADGAKVYSYWWHGWRAGSSILNEEAGTGYAMADVTTRFPGPIYAYSCSTAAPDEASWSLGEKLLQAIGGVTPDGAADPAKVGPIAYVGYDRVLVGEMVDPMKWAAVKGRRTLGDIVVGTVDDRIGDLSGRINSRATTSELMYGIPNLEVIPDPTMSVSALATQTNSDGTVDVYIEAKAPGGTQSGLLVGDRKVTDLDFSKGSQRGKVTMTAKEVANESLIHLDACDPATTSCRAGSPKALRDLPMHCGDLVPMADGTFDLDLTTPVGQAGPVGSMFVEAVAVTMKCDGGIRSDCFADVWSWRRHETVLDRLEVPAPKGASEARMEPGDNRFNFDLTGVDYGDGYQFRALKVRLVGVTGSEIGSCYVRLSEADALDYGLL